MDPPFYGRVFVSYIEGAGSGTLKKTKFITENLRSLSPVSILPSLSLQKISIFLSRTVYNTTLQTQQEQEVLLTHSKMLLKQSMEK